MIYELSKMSKLDVHAVSLSCTTTYLHYHKSEYYQYIVDYLLEKTQGKWTEAVRWFVSNMARSLNNNGSGMYVSFDPGYYSHNKAKIGFKTTQSVLKMLEERAFINIYKGYVDEWKIDNGKRIPEKVVLSCIIFRPRLLELWKSQDVNIFDEYFIEDPVEVRSRKTGDVLSTRGKIGIKEEREKMTNYNSSLKDADIKYNGVPVATVQYKKIYLDTMHIAGRIYAAGGGVQLLPQKLRNDYLTIDGEPVSEIDYSAVHPSICLQMLIKDGVDVVDLIGKDFSPYDADLSFVKLDQEAIDNMSSLLGKRYNPLRNLAKIAILIGINSVDEQQAVGAMSGKVNEDSRKDLEDRLFVGIDGKVPVKRILEEIKKHNDIIADNFYKDRGVVLQKIDADIMMSVIETMIQKNHTVLVYHDSCLCKQSAEEDLRQAMIDAWYTVFGDTTYCKVEKK